MKVIFLQDVKGSGKIRKEFYGKGKKDVEKQNAEDIKAAIDGKTVKTSANAGSNGRLFGSITTGNIADLIEKQFGKKIDKKKISLKTEIKNFGTYEAEIRLYNGVTAKVTVEVTES